MRTRLSRGLLCQGRPLTLPKPIKMIATMTLLIGVALLLAALLF